MSGLPTEGWERHRLRISSTRTVSAQSWNSVESQLRTLTESAEESFARLIEPELRSIYEKFVPDAFSAIGENWLDSPRTGSIISRDARNLSPIKSIDNLTHLGVSAIRHGRAIIDLAFSDSEFDPLIAWTLSRTVLEQSAAIAWLLMPSDDVERWTRSLRWHLWNNHNRALAQSSTGRASAVDDVQRDEILQVALALGITIKKSDRLSWSEIVGWLDTAIHKNAYSPEGREIRSNLMMWNIASGIQHGMEWPGKIAFESPQNATSDDVFFPIVTATAALSNASWAWMRAMKEFHTPTAASRPRTRTRTRRTPT